MRFVSPTRWIDLLAPLFVEPYEGLDLPSGSLIQLVAPVYGLNDAPLRWHRTLTAWLIKQGYRKSLLEPSLYVHYAPGGSVDGLILIEVDDLAIGTKRIQEAEFQRRFQAAFRFGKWEKREATYAGRRIRQRDQYVRVDQEKNVWKNFTLYLCAKTAERQEALTLGSPTPSGTGNHALFQKISALFQTCKDAETTGQVDTNSDHEAVIVRSTNLSTSRHNNQRTAKKKKRRRSEDQRTEWSKHTIHVYHAHQEHALNATSPNAATIPAALEELTEAQKCHDHLCSNDAKRTTHDNTTATNERADHSDNFRRNAARCLPWSTPPRASLATTIL